MQVRSGAGELGAVCGRVRKLAGQHNRMSPDGDAHRSCSVIGVVQIIFVGARRQEVAAADDVIRGGRDEGAYVVAERNSHRRTIQIPTAKKARGIVCVIGPAKNARIDSAGQGFGNRLGR